MKPFTLHKAVDGTPLEINPAMVRQIKEEPRGQALVVFTDGSSEQPAEDVETCLRLWGDAAVS